MTQEEIISMAHEAEIYVVRPDEFQNLCIKDLERFAKLVAEKEREKNRAYIHELELELETTQDRLNELLVADYIKTRNKQ